MDTVWLKLLLATPAIVVHRSILVQRTKATMSQHASDGLNGGGDGVGMVGGMAGGLGGVIGGIGNNNGPNKYPPTMKFQSVFV